MSRAGPYKNGNNSADIWKCFFVVLLKYLIFGNKCFKCKVPAFEQSFVSLWQTTNMNIHLSTEFKTEDKLEYQFIPVTSGEMTFKVRAPNDVYVALTTAPTKGDPMYEVSYKIFYLRTHNDQFVFSPRCYTSFFTSVGICIYF